MSIFTLKNLNTLTLQEAPHDATRVDYAEHCMLGCMDPLHRVAFKNNLLWHVLSGLYVKRPFSFRQSTKVIFRHEKGRLFILEANPLGIRL